MSDRKLHQSAAVVEYEMCLDVSRERKKSILKLKLIETH